MAIENILVEIDAEIARLQQARALLATLGTSATKAGRPAKKAPAKAKTRKKRVLSAEAQALGQAESQGEVKGLRIKGRSKPVFISSGIK